MKHRQVLFFCCTVLIFARCTRPVGCIDQSAYNYDPDAAVANASCRYPSLYLSFELLVDSLPFEINRIYSINGSATAFKQFQFYVSSINIKKESGDSLYLPALYPLIKAGQQQFFLSEIGLSSVQKLQFDIGIDAVNNNQITNFLMNAAHPLFIQVPDTMHFNFNDGYIFLKMLGKIDRNADGIPNENESFDLRIGTNSLLRSVQFNLDKAIKGPSDTLRVQLNIANLLQGIDLPQESYANSNQNIALATRLADNIAAAFSIP